MRIDTRGLEIPDEPKITADMRAIDNGAGARNHVFDPPNAYSGEIGIEIRGSSSRDLFDKKSFAVETRNADGSNRNVALLGLPVENDWVLHGPYSDKTLLRNVLAMYIGRSMGRYASRWRLVELILNDNYHGVYVLMEKVKRDNDRIDISRLEPSDTSGDAVTGGYVIKIDKMDGSEVGGWFSEYETMTDASRTTFYQYHYPRPSEITPEQRAYIQEFFRNFESVMWSDDFANPASGYPSLMDVDSAVDYVLHSEVTNNVDAYRLSTFMYKDRDSVDGRLVLGPPWDYNIAFGNANYYDGASTSDFRVNEPLPSDDAFHGPFWWRKLTADTSFAGALVERWNELRASTLSAERLALFVDQYADTLEEAQQRNFERWPVLNQWIWPNVVVTGSYAAEVAYLKSWLSDRLDWLDESLPEIGESTTVKPGPRDDSHFRLSVYPNPAHDATTIQVQLPVRAGRVHVAVYDLLGREVAVLKDGFVGTSESLTLHLTTAELDSGLYIVRVIGSRTATAKKFAVVSE